MASLKSTATKSKKVKVETPKVQRVSENSLSEEFHKDRRSASSGMTRASSISFCSRRIGYSIQGVEALPENSHSLFTFGLGSAIHLLIQQKLIQMGLIKAVPYFDDEGELAFKSTPEDPKSGCELKFWDDDNKLSGHCDGVTVPLIKKGTDDLFDFIPAPEGVEGHRYLVEIKSITDRPAFLVRGIRDGGTHMIDEKNLPSDLIEIKPQKSGSSDRWQQMLSNFQHTRKVRTSYGAVRDFPVYKVKTELGEELITVIMVLNMQGSFSYLQHPKSEHIQQASLYASKFGCDRIMFIYVGKDINPRGYESQGNLLNIPIKVFEHLVEDEAVDSLLFKNKQIHTYLEEGRLPPREYTEESKECNWCPYRHQCYPGSVDLGSINQELRKAGFKELEEE